MTTKGLYFDGTKQQYAHFDATGRGFPAAGADRTLEFWIRAPGVAATRPVWSGDDSHQSIIELGDVTNKGSAFGVFLDIQQKVANLNFSGYYADKHQEALHVGTLPDDQWHFVAITYTGTGTSTKLGVYLDGKSQGSFPIVTSEAIRTLTCEDCYIGGFPSQNTWYFTGSVSDIRIWNVVRTATQIQGDMTNPCTPSTPIPGLVASIPLDKGQGITFKVQDASGNTITEGNITGAAWNKPLVPNPDPISEGIWFVIQSKADVNTDLDVPAKRFALTMDDKGQIVMSVIPLEGNYDPFLWRAVVSEDPTTYRLVNKSLHDTSSLVDYDDLGLQILQDPTGTLQDPTGGQPPHKNKWSLAPANKDNWGTNAYFLTRKSQPLQRIAYDNGTSKVLLKTTDDTDTQQVWLLQPMEVVLGYYIPSPLLTENACPFTKQLDSEFGVTFYGTITTSDWAMLNTHLVIRNEINAIQASRRSSDTFKGWKVLVISGFDNNPESVAGYPMIKSIVDQYGISTVRDFWGGTHPGFKTVLLTESMMCHQGVPYRRPSDTTNREFDQVVHEFGHAIDDTILNSSQDPPRQKDEAKAFWGGAVEWFPIQVQSWFNNAQSYGSGAAQKRSALSSEASRYLETIFNKLNDWLPPRWLHNHLWDTFELRSGDVLTNWQALSSHGSKLVLQLLVDGNLAVSDAGNIKWGSYQNLKIALYIIQSVSMTDDGHLQLLDRSGMVGKTLPENATPAPGPGARLIVSAPDPGKPNSYLKILDKSDTTVWTSS